MLAPPFSVNDALWRASRLTARVDLRAVSVWRDAAVYLLAGLGAALCVHFLDFNLKIPGHAILRSVVPVTFGMALAPRRLAGAMIGTSALAATGLLSRLGAEGVGWGAFTSLLVIGPMLDAALWQTRGGKAIFLRCALAGVVTNLAAFAIRGGGKMAGLDSISMRKLTDWWSIAPVTYVVCGLLAGLAGALLWFRWSPETRDSKGGGSE